jgi:predicted RNase H-like HicB family nuclease
MTADYHINIFFRDEDGGYMADIPDLEYCSAFGDTPEEALREVLIAKQAWLESATGKHKLIPKPTYPSTSFALKKTTRRKAKSV